MSPHAVSNFVGDLVEMAKAFEELPKVREELVHVKGECTAFQDMIQSREVHILSLKAELEAAQATIRSLEVARDDAELRFLEADDRANHSIVALRTIAANLGSAITVLDPPKPEPVQAQPVEVKEEPPISSWATPEGQSVADPTTNANDGGGSSEQTSVISSATEDATSDKPKPGPYASKRYYDHQFYVNREQWIAGGGSEADYDWRPDTGSVARY